ncbi:type IV pilus twitching motility protein PilT, partial [Myxococcota bacterium]|nr:type IV pilus twitching motility protein PilT [Myxococcota bacterium]
DKQRKDYEEFLETDFSFEIPKLARFRVNAFNQNRGSAAVFRTIPSEILTLDDLGAPPIFKDVSMHPRGIVLVTGPTGSGKSTTLAAMVDYINENKPDHILTIEDPIEFLLRDKRSIINQREVGVDTDSFAAALRSALRQDPDVILVGEMRDIETIEIALTAAETGHLVMSTLHTLDTTETINRIVSAFPPHQQKMARLQLGAVLKAVVSQRLVPKADGRGRVPALEILRNTARVRELIEDKDRTKEIAEALAIGHTTYGMQTFDQSLMNLLGRKLISYKEALRQASNPDDFALRVSGVSGTSDASWETFENIEKHEGGKHTPPALVTKSSAPTPPRAKEPAASQDAPAQEGFEIERF